MSFKKNLFNKKNFLFTEQFNNHSVKEISNKIIPLKKKVFGLRQKDFITGPVIIKEPGIYKLMENISFSPNPENDGKPTDEQIKQLPLAFNLGFFAAIIVACDEVIVDLNKFTLSQSLIHSIQQTFYANIQIGGSPFIKKQGPSLFDDEVKAPSHIIIKNGKLGLSSHHGIHCATGVNQSVISDLEIENFGVAGIHINGGNSLYINNIHIDNQKSNILFDSTLSFAIFMIPHFKHLLKNYPDLSIKIQNKVVQIDELHNELQNEINKAFESVNKNIKYRGPFKNKDGPLYDANLYGLVLNSKGILINDFKKLNNELVEDNYDIVLNNVKIENCVSAGTEVIVMTNKEIEKEKTSYGAGVIKGVHGDVIDFEKIINKNGTYKSDLVVNSQIFLAKHKSLLKFNTANITDEVIEWVENPNVNINDLIKSKKLYVVRGRDSMAHVMKGNIGLFISQGDQILANNVSIKNIDNKSTPTLKFKLTDEFTKLSSSYGSLISGSKNITFKNVSIKEIKSKNGITESIAFKNNCLNFGSLDK